MRLSIQITQDDRMRPAINDHNRQISFTILAVLVLIVIGLLPARAVSPEAPEGRWGGPNDPASTNAQSQSQPQRAEEQENRSLNHLAVLTTSYGVIVFELFENLTPITSGNFIKLASEQFYDGCKFHRVIDDFVIQTGDPNSKDNNPYDDGYGGSEETIPLEIAEELTHVDGAVGMARSSEPDSASSQFYICDTEQHQLDGDYAVFGLVVEGMDVVRTIASAETWGYRRPLLQDRPVEDIVLESVAIIEQEPPVLPEEPTPKPSSHPVPAFETATFLSAFMATVITVIILHRKRNC